MDVNFKTAIFKTDISDHFLVCIIIFSNKKLVKNKTLSKRLITDDATERFNQALYESHWVDIETCDNSSECYKLFLKNSYYLQKSFSRKKIKLKVKDIQSPLITSGIKKFSKPKQGLYEKFSELQ